MPKPKKKEKTRRKLIVKDAKAGKLKYGKAYLELDADLEAKKAFWEKKHPNEIFSWEKLIKSKKK